MEIGMSKPILDILCKNVLAFKGIPTIPLRRSRLLGFAEARPSSFIADERFVLCSRMEKSAADMVNLITV